MYFEWGNGAVKVGRDLMRGPHSWHIAIGYNNRELLTGRPTPKGEFRAADWHEMSWQWPGFRGFRYWSHHMHHSLTEWDPIN